MRYRKHHKQLKYRTHEWGLTDWIGMLGIILFCILLDKCSNMEFSFNPTPEPGYTGKCHHWSEAAKWDGSKTCIWGYPTSAEVSVSGVWLHFSERNHPYPDFAAKIECLNCDSWGFPLTGRNVEAKYKERCVEIYGLLKIEGNTYKNKSASQPVIRVTDANQIVFCK